MTEIMFVLIVIILGITIVFSRKKILADYYIELSLAISALLTMSLKSTFMRLRPITSFPFELGYGFPSSHASISAAFFTALYLAYISKVKKGTHRILFTVFCIASPIFIGTSRITLGVHYFTDVFAGLSLGFIVALTLCALFADKLFSKKK
jgi:undecaprenyl-diphosphatase